MNNTITDGVANWTDPLLHNVSCTGPHSDDPKMYQYSLTDGFIGGATFLASINFIAILPTVILNTCIIIAFIQQRKLRTTSNRLLFSISIADLLTGAVVETVYGTHIIQVTKFQHECVLSNMIVFLVPVLIVITMVSHTAVALERYCSIRHPNVYPKIFTKRYITWLMIFIWISCFLCFIVPLLNSEAIIGTKIIVTVILLSLAVCAFSYISMYQDSQWRHGKPKAKIQGPYIIREIKTKDRTLNEMEDFRQNVRVSAFFFKLFLCMIIFYLLNLIKNVINGYEIFNGNGHYLVHYIFDTVLFVHALINPIFVLYFSSEIATAVRMIFN